VLLLWSLSLSGRALADERIEGIVLRTKVTHCDVTKAGGCAGTLTLARPGAGKAEPLTLRVPLGTPISCAGERMYLHALQARAWSSRFPTLAMARYGLSASRKPSHAEQRR
jgi:hypothetical protein